MESVRLPHWWRSNIPITLRTGLHAQNHSLLYNILESCQLWEQLVYKEVGTSHISMLGLQRVCTAPPLNKSMSGISTAPHIFPCLPESWVKMPSRERLQATWNSHSKVGGKYCSGDWWHVGVEEVVQDDALVSGWINGTTIHWNKDRNKTRLKDSILELYYLIWRLL